MTKKAMLFERQVRNFWLVRKTFLDLRVSPDFDDMVLCPLCFKRYAISANDKTMSLEHAPPKKLGGKIVALTCRSCNNRHGSAFEGKLLEFYQVAQAFDGNNHDPIDARFQVNDLQPIRVKLQHRLPNTISMSVIEKTSNPASIRDIDQLLNASQKSAIPQLSVKVLISLPNKRLVDIALTRIAYLLAFEQFGYGFIINPALDRVRSMLEDPHNPEYAPFGVISYKSMSFPDELVGINIITNPVAMRSFFVVFDLQYKNRFLDRIGVILPGWVEDTTNLCKHLESIEGSIVTLSMSKVPTDVDFHFQEPAGTLALWKALFGTEK